MSDTLLILAAVIVTTSQNLAFYFLLRERLASNSRTNKGINKRFSDEMKIRATERGTSGHNFSKIFYALKKLGIDLEQLEQERQVEKSAKRKEERMYWLKNNPGVPEHMRSAKNVDSR